MQVEGEVLARQPLERAQELLVVDQSLSLEGRLGQCHCI